MISATSLCLLLTIWSALTYFPVVFAADPSIDLGYVKYIGKPGSAIKYANNSAAPYHFALPYAYPPVGSLRWLAPKPIYGSPPSTISIISAIVPGPACIQGVPAWHANPFASPTCPVSEACLTLDIITPNNANNLPVMLRIHGGGYTEGQSEYSNGIPDLTHSKWAFVWVTIAEYLWWPPHHETNVQVSQFQDILQETGCPDVACLRSWGERKLANVTRKTYVTAYFNHQYGYGDFYFGPVVDGKVILDLPSREFERGRFRQVPLMTTHTQYEFFIFSNGTMKTGLELISDLKQFFPNATNPFVEQIILLYPTAKS
ncbi:alpha/beta-hydrolase [Microthyrium microscopicum]|uniref:Alpha/beta-hydrolase n=1 Tax=Microthyrium microscopicum TaxID=703497 RepID=A0A6A6U7U2_9PEZI|nr:alpha/beta-hydrolase [Microthyrium microscopicum]